MNQLPLDTFQFAFLPRKFYVPTFQIFFVTARISQQGPPLKPTRYAEFQYVEIARLKKIIVSPHPNCVDYTLGAIDTGNHDYRGVAIEFVDLAQQFNPTQSRHLDIRQYHRKGLSLKPFQGLLRVRCRFTRITLV